MSKWQKMDEAADLLGRGLGKEELISRVALDVGASVSQVRSALKAESHRQQTRKI